MGNKLKKLIMFLVVVLGMTLFANEEQKAPNEIIKDNPEREVTTVESMKVRDHATMSLSVTKKNEKVIEGELVGNRLKVQLPVKGINENTLDRMAKPKEGKKLVVESKSKINPRMARMATKDIKKMPTQEEMNNLTVKQIQAMMSDTTDKKEEESQSKNIKNHIATENKEGIDVEILDVNKNEDIYVNVEENGKIIDRYRVAILNAVNPKISITTPNHLTGFLTNETVKLESDKAWIISKGDGGRYSNASFPYLFEAIASHHNLTDFYFKDEYFTTQRSMKFKNSNQTNLFGVAFQLKRISNNSETNGYYATHVFHDSRTLLDAENNDRTKVVNTSSFANTTNPKDGYGYGGYYSNLNQFRMIELVGTGGKDYNGFRYIKLSEYKPNSTQNNLDSGTATGFLKYGVVEKVGFEAELDIADGKRAPYPGVYTSGSNQALVGTYKGYIDPNSPNRTYEYTHEARDIKIDVADEKIKKGNTLSPKVLTKNFDKQVTIGTEDIVTDGSNSIGDDKVISFMSKNTSGDLGLWFASGDGQKAGTRIIPNTEHERTYIQEGLNQKFKVKVTQADNNWAKIVVIPLEIHNPTSSTTAKPKLEFTIVQGRQDGAYGVVELRRVKYTITYNRTLKPIGTMVTKIDPRLNQRANYWLTLGGNGGTDITTLPTTNDYTGLFKNDSNWTESRTIKTIDSVYKGNTKYDDIGKNGQYFRYGRSGTPYLGIKQILTDGNIIDTNKLEETNNFARKIGEKETLTTYFTAANNSPFSFTHELKIEGNLNLDRNNFTDNDGYKGSGNIDLTGKKVEHEYTLSRPQLDANETDNILHINGISGYITIFAGLVEGQKNTEIVDSYKISVGTTELGTVTFGSNNQGVITNDGALKIKLVKNNDVNNKRNIKLTKLEDIDFDKNIKIEYYHKSGIKLGEFTLRVTNTKTVTPTGTLTTTIDPRLAKLTTEEWLTLGNFSGGTDLADLTVNKYSGLIKATTNQLDPQKTIKEIIKVSKGGTTYSYLKPDNASYKRYGTGNTPSIAILTTKSDGNIADTNALQSNDNFARKVKDQGSINFEFKAGDNYYYSFDHNLTIEPNPSGEPGKFTAEKGYIGSATVNLSGKNLNTPYTLIRDKEEVVGNEVQISNQSGWIPTFNGVVQEYLDRVIVDSYTIKIGNDSTSNKIVFGPNNNGYDSTNFHIKLIRPNTVENKKNIQITKKNDETYSQVVFIEYYHSSGVKLGEFTLTVNNTRTERDLGVSTVKLDPRILQVNEGYSWIDLKNGEMLSFDNNNQVIGNYTDFIGVPSTFSNANSNSNYNNFNLEKVLKINDSTAVGIDAYTFNGKKYTVTTGKNEAAFPTNLTLQEFLKVDGDSKLVISKWDATHSDHKKNNKFLISGESGNQTVAFTGNIEEVYLDKEGVEITSPTIDKTQYKFIGNGTLNLAPATVGDSYWFAKTGSGELRGNGNSNEIVLKLASNSDPLNAAGIIPKSSSNRVANKMVLTVGGNKKPDIMLTNGKLEEELTIKDGKVKIAIDSQGRLEVTKTQEGNIPSTPIEIKYYYKPSTNISTNEIHLGTFTLTVENPVVEIGTRNVKIDKRFVNKDGYNWLLGNNTAKGSINDNTTSNSFTSLFKYEGNFKNLVADTIERAIKIEDRPVRGNAPSNAEYLNFIVGTGVYQDEAAVLNKGTINELTNKVIVSKYNGADSSLTNNGLLNNKFYILAKDSNDKYKIYTGNVTEEIVGNGVISGTGSVIFRDINNGKTYTFNPGAGGSATATTDNTTMTITVNQGGKLLDGRGQSNIQSGNIANKITVSKDGNISGTGNSATVDGITFGISSAGGLTISKSNSVSLTEDTTYTIKFYYSAESVDIELSTFNLTVKKTEAKDVGDIEFEVDPRLVKISSVDSGSINWISGDKMFGSWSTKEDYSNVIYTNSTIKDTTTIDYIDAVTDKFRGTYSDYTIFKTAETGGYNIIAFKTGVALNNYLSEKNLMLSPAVAQTFETIFEGTDGNKYKTEIILTHANGVSQDGYSGSGVLDISNGIKGTEYLFSAPTDMNTGSGTSTSNGGLSMTIKGNFPNTNGIVTGKKNISIADSVVVSVNGATATSEIDSSVIGNKIYKVNNNLKLGLTSDNQIKIIKISNEFDYKGTGAIEIKYKYKEVTLGSFTLEISSKEVDAGSITFDVDSRLEQLSQTLGNYVTGNKTLGDKNYGNHNKIFSELIKVTPSYLNGAGEVTNVTIDSVKGKKEISSGMVTDYVGFGKNETGSAEIILKRSSGRLEDYGGNTKDTLISILNSETYIAKIQANTGKIYSLDFVLNRNEGAPKDGYTGTGSLSLAPAVLDKEYKFDPGLMTDTTKDEITLKITGADSRSIDTRGLVNSTDSIANLMEITVNSAKDPIRVVGTVGQAFEKTKIPVGEAEITLGIETNGGFKIVKTKEGNIDNVPVRVDYYYSTNTNDINAAKIKLGTFILTIDNPVIISTQDVTVEIDKRFENLEGYNWLFSNGDVSSEIKPSPTEKRKEFNNFFTFSGNLDSQNGTIVRDLGMTGREVKNPNNTSAKYGYYQLTGETTSKGEGAIPRSGDMSQLNSLITISKGNNPNEPRSLENEFSLLFTDDTNGNRYSIYKGKIIEEIKGIGKYNGTGKIKEKDLVQGTSYIFSIKMTKMGTITSNNEGVSIVEASGIPVNALGVVSGKDSTVVANKIIVKYKEENESGAITENTIESNGNLSVSYGGLTVGIDSSKGGLTLQKTQEKTNITEVVINYLYEVTIGNEKKTVDLGTFTLTIEKDIITIDPDDAFLDFGTMIYDSRDGGETHETRVKKFKVINEAGKEINFKVDKAVGEMISNSNKLELRNISVKKDSNTEFTLQATAVLDKNTQPGSYEGTIEVIVDIK